MKIKPILFSSLFLFLSCSATETNIEPARVDNANVVKDSVKKEHLQEKIEPLKKKKVLTGIEVLKENDFQILQGKRIGLITNQTGVDINLKSTIDILNEAETVNLVALFGPEHGVRGDIEGGLKVDNYRDPKTNIPVFSLYGKTKKPTKEMLSSIDALVYDIQDIGVRSYTFISTMGLAMEAAAENGLDFIVLDRPNPLGGEKIEGNIVESEYISFISQFPIPYVYGLTCGELAKYLVGENLLNLKHRLKLEVVPLKNWERHFTWNDTNLKWIPTSPHIPNERTAIFYPMAGILGELRSAISIGVGYTLPFQIVGAEWINGTELVEKLNSMEIPGLIFRPITFKPYYAYGKGKTLHGAHIYINDYSKVNLTNTQFYIMHALKSLYPEMNLFKMCSEPEIMMFNKGIGTDKIKQLLEKQNLKGVLDYLNKDIDEFKIKRKKYLLY